MKKKRLLIALLSAGMAFSLAACGEAENKGDDTKPTDVIPDDGGDNQQGDNNQDQPKEDEVDFTEGETDSTVLKNEAKAQVNSLCTSANLSGNEKVVLDVLQKFVLMKMDSVTGDANAIKKELNQYYKWIYDGTALIKQVTISVQDTRVKVLAELELVKEAANAVASKANAKYIESVLEQLKKEVTSAETKEAIMEAVSSIAEMATDYVINIIDQEIANAINEAQGRLDALYESVMAKAPQSLKQSITDVYDAASLALSKINSTADLANIESIFNDFRTSIIEIGSDLIELTVDELKALANDQLIKAKNLLISKLPEGALTDKITDFCDTEIAKINAVSDLDSAKELISTIDEDCEAFAKECYDIILAEMKSTLFAELDPIVANALAKLSDEELKGQLNDAYDDLKADVNLIVDYETAKDALASIKTDFTNNIKTIIASQLSKLKTAAIAEINDLVNDAISLIEDEELEAELSEFATTQIGKINAVTDIDSAKETFTSIKNDTVTFVSSKLQEMLVTLKTKAIEELDEIVAAGLAKLPNDTLKNSLNSFYETEVAKIEAVETVEDLMTVKDEVIEDTKLYIKELVASTLAEARALMKTYLERINTATSVTPFDFVPEAMRQNYSFNLVNREEVTYDFNQFVNVADINYGGFGEQWNMVLDSINKNQRICKVFSKGETIINAAAVAANAYLDSKYADSLNYKLEETGFNLELNYEESVLYYDITFNTSISIPLVGEVTPVIHMEYDGTTGQKTFFIQLTNTNIVKYTITDNSYTFALEVGIEKGKKTSYVSFERDDSNKVEGHIYEYITVAGKDAVKSCADFYIDDEYVSVVGNKASGMVAFKGYINELYKTNEGKLLGYEVRETLSAVTYNTLWFNLNDISLITNIKVQELSDSNPSSKSTVDVYINNSSTLFNPTYNKKLGVKTSRKYDVEFRTRHFYSYDEENDSYIDIEVELPMMFIQEGENFSTFTADMTTDNGVASIVKTNTNDLNKILEDYDTLIDIFIENKDLIDSNYIEEYLGIIKE